VTAESTRLRVESIVKKIHVREPVKKGPAETGPVSKMKRPEGNPGRVPGAYPGRTARSTGAASLDMAGAYNVR